MTFLPMLLAGILGFVAVVALVPLFLRSASSLIDSRRRDFHHSHPTGVPRFGGLALVAAFALVELFITVGFPEERAGTPNRTVVLAGAFVMFGVGFWDDLRPLGPRTKLLIQIAVAALVHLLGVQVTAFRMPLTGEMVYLGPWSIAFTVIWLVGMTNLINLADGVDGLAGGICLMNMGLLAYVGYQTGYFPLLASGTVGALLGFLIFNFPPARVYMGDGGAYFLGFTIGAFSIINSQKGTIVAALIAPLFVLTIPITDAVLALLRRGLRGLPVFRPDRRHIHHRLLETGLSHKRAVLLFYAVTVVFLALGFLVFVSQGQHIPVLFGVVLLVLLVCAGSFDFSKRWFAVPSVIGSSLAMRQEVQCAVALTRWVSLEAKKCQTPAELWPSFLFAARKLGFDSIRVRLPNWEGSWSELPGNEPRYELGYAIGAGTGSLEISVAGAKAPGTELNRKILEIFGELLAESWSRSFRSAKHPISESPVRTENPLSLSGGGGLRKYHSEVQVKSPN